MSLPNDGVLKIREVWASNLYEEIAIIRDLVDDFPLLAMDTEFPGVVVRSVGNPRGADAYQTMKANVDMLKLIQLGLTFADEDGNLPHFGEEYCVWQFNFKEFRLKEDIYAHDSIELLKESGIDFQKFETDGIDAHEFGALLMSSGIVLNENVHWVTFHSGYDFGYLLKLLTCKELPPTETEFFDRLQDFFPNLYDVKYMMKFCNNLHGGLNRLAEILDVKRIGPSHQAGSDSLLTFCSFIKLKKEFFNGSTEKFAGVLYGFEPDREN